MSGIAGCWHFDSGPANAAHLDRMLDAIRHRGPQCVGTWFCDSLSLGHRLIAPSSDRTPLPLLDPPSGQVITADARLDNATELAAELGLDYPYLPADTVARDAVLILAAYQKWGANCPEKLYGDFAFAIWNPVDRQLFLARDPFGIRPLVYFHSPALFAFGSEAKALLAHSDIPKVLNRARVADYLVPWLEALDFESTFFENIYRLPPGSTLTISADNCQPRVVRWFHLDPTVPKLRLPSDREYEAAFLAQFTAAVDRCLNRPGSVGSMLSGGIDSSSVCAVAQRLLSQRDKGILPVFSAISVETPCGIETDMIEAVIQHTGIAPHRITPGDLRALDIDTANAIRQSDDPFDFRISIIPALFADAARNGCSTLMTGVDGDISVGVSQRYLIHLLRSGNLIQVIRETLGLSQNLASGWRYAAHLLAFSIKSVLAPRRTRRLHRQRKLKEILERSPINPDFAKETDILGRLGRIFDSELPEPEPQTLRHRLALLVQLPLITAALERYDRSAHRFSVEPAHPFLDRRLVEFALSLPANQRVRFGWGKWILRQAIKNQVPEAVRWRRENVWVNQQFAEATKANFIKDSISPMSDPFSRIRPYVHPQWLQITNGSGSKSVVSLDEHPDQCQLQALLHLNYWLEEHFPL